MSDVDEILRKYRRKIAGQVGKTPNKSIGDLSKEYLQFKQDMMPQLSRYEKLAKSFGSLININLSEKDRVKMQKNLDTAHLDITGSEVLVFSFFSMFITFSIGLLVFLLAFFYSVPSFTMDVLMTYLFGPAGLFLFLVFVASMFVFYYTYTSPQRLANKWRLKAGSQMVPCILFVVVYMKHTSNLERAIAFASQHLRPPLSLDLKKIFWDVETGRFSTIKQSLDNYLKTWEKEGLEFVEAFHLVESSLYEHSEDRRIQILEKALKVILDGVYEKMMVFSREVRSPLTNLYMLGVVLPTLGLALLPLASTLLGGMIKSYHVFILFNLIVPFFVFYLSSQIMLKRPGGYGESEILELNPDYHKYKSKKPYLIAGLICLPLFLIGISPLLFQIPVFVQTLGLQPDYVFNFLGEIRLFDYKDLVTGSSINTIQELKDAGKVVGPFGLGGLLLGLFIPVSIAMFFSIAYGMKTKDLIKHRENTTQLEKEFTNSLFQLGNRLGDGMPAEMAFARVAESTHGQRTEDFFRKVNINLHQAGMGLERAILIREEGQLFIFLHN